MQKAPRILLHERYDILAIRCRAFRDILNNAGVSATLRLEKGHDIDAACGQLRLKQETEEGIIGPA
jgi:adenine C2-methylase RlmN of 23S rRNA A2503 and tRNA A37